MARYASQELSSDKVVRPKLYEQAGLSPDDTVRQASGSPGNRARENVEAPAGRPD